MYFNALTAVLTFASLIGYAIVQTVWLKHAIPQNIVIGGATRARLELTPDTTALCAVGTGTFGDKLAWWSNDE
jgi:hypothetical protein